MEEVRHYVHKHASYAEFTMCPGDVLYIPRGHVHNASTILFNDLEYQGKDWNEWEDCPSYPKDSAIARQMADRLPGPSLHLTFGLEQRCEGTLEALLHHALHAYFASFAREISKLSEGLTDAPEALEVELEVIPPKTCSNPNQTPSDHGISWKAVLHHSLAEVARREHPCDNPSFRGIDKVKCDGTALLRRSVPLLLLQNNEFVGIQKGDGSGDINDGGDDDGGDNADGVQLSNLKPLKLAYLRALNTFASSSHIPQTVEFVNKHLLRPTSTASNGEYLPFCYPKYNENEVIKCPDELLNLPAARLDNYSQILQSFVRFAKNNFEVALEDMNRHGKGIRGRDRRRQEEELDRVGQRGTL